MLSKRKAAQAFWAATLLTTFAFTVPLKIEGGYGIKRSSWETYRGRHYFVRNLNIEDNGFTLVYKQNLEYFYYTKSPFNKLINYQDEITLGIESQILLSETESLFISYYPQEYVDEIFFYKNSGNLAENKKIYNQKLQFGFEKQNDNYNISFGVNLIRDSFDIYHVYHNFVGTQVIQSNYYIDIPNWKLIYTGMTFQYQIAMNTDSISADFLVHPLPDNTFYVGNLSWEIINQEFYNSSLKIKANFDHKSNKNVYSSNPDFIKIGIDNNISIDDFLIGINLAYFNVKDWMVFDINPITYEYKTLDGCKIELILKYQDLIGISYKPISGEMYISTSFEL